MMIALCILLYLGIILCLDADKEVPKTAKEIEEEAVQWDEEMKFHLNHFYETADMRQSNCKDKNPGNSSSKLSLKDLGSKEITRVMKPSYEFFGVVTDEKKRATAHLTRAALSLPSGGDIVETGVFTGSSTSIVMKILLEYDHCLRKFYVFDSFCGLPERREKDRAHSMNNIAGGFEATQEQFESNLKKVGLHDPNILIISKGWFNTTLRLSPVQNIAFLRMDGDLYTSTKETIEAMYDKVVPGGFIYVDDYGSFIGCRTAIDEFRKARGISDTIRFVRPMVENWRSPHIEFDGSDLVAKIESPSKNSEDNPPNGLRTYLLISLSCSCHAAVDAVTKLTNNLSVRAMKLPLSVTMLTNHLSAVTERYD